MYLISEATDIHILKRTSFHLPPFSNLALMLCFPFMFFFFLPWFLHFLLWFYCFYNIPFSYSCAKHFLLWQCLEKTVFIVLSPHRYVFSAAVLSERWHKSFQAEFHDAWWRGDVGTEEQPSEFWWFSRSLSLKQQERVSSLEEAVLSKYPSSYNLSVLNL